MADLEEKVEGAVEADIAASEAEAEAAKASAAADTVAAATAAAALAETEAAKAMQVAAETINKAEGDLSWLKSHAEQMGSFSQSQTERLTKVETEQATFREEVKQSFTNLMTGIESLIRPPSNPGEVNPVAEEKKKEGGAGPKKSEKKKRRVI